MIHVMDGEWSIHSQPLIINCRSLYSFISMKGIEPTEIHIDMIAHKELESISLDSIRYLRANTNLPGIVAKNMQNPHMKEYRMLDGRHRLKKSLEHGMKSFTAYVITPEDAMKFAIASI
jgi:hypothetical protein